ncbi:hypothetical protein [Pararhodobacter sp.]|uniref:hypothetical protein n=1 Tax=Pararhodobacter sp. TaxID=2127056 RepID=UPI002FDC9729
MAHALHPSDIDALGEFVLQRLLTEGGTAREAVRALVEHMSQLFPQAQALSPVLVLAIVANGLEEILGKSVQPETPAADLWRMATLLAIDVMTLERDDAVRRNVVDLLEHWRARDPFFLS